jgi:DNA-directed RNA polymerase subunit alpha
MISLDQFTIKRNDKSANIAEFEIGPLPKGYGNTMGTYLRRVLLASVPGSAITAIKVNGIMHEYSTLEGLTDDILKLVLSVKNVVPVSKSTTPVTLDIEVKGKKGEVVEVKAGDIAENSDVSIVNKDYVITKLTNEKASFKASIIVERGIGYSLPNEEVRKELGMLPVDAKFSPVKLVSYEVGDTRVGKETELDLLKLTVETNGAVTPQEALFVASDILKQMTDNLLKQAESQIKGDEVSVIVGEKEKEERKQQQQQIAKKEEEKQPLKVLDLNLSTRLTNALLRAGIDDLRSLEGMTEEEAMGIRGMGNKSFVELLDILKGQNIKLV